MPRFHLTCFRIKLFNFGERQNSEPQKSHFQLGVFPQVLIFLTVETANEVSDLLKVLNLTPFPGSSYDFSAVSACFRGRFCSEPIDPIDGQCRPQLETPTEQLNLSKLAAPRSEKCQLHQLLTGSEGTKPRRGVFGTALAKST